MELTTFIEEMSRIAEGLLDIPVRGADRRALMLEYARRLHVIAKAAKEFAAR